MSTATRETSTTAGTVNDAWREALNRHDPDAVAACFAEDGVMVENGTGQRCAGRSAIRETAVGFFKAFSELNIEQTSHLTSGSMFSAEWTMSGVHTGDLPGLPATGRSFSVVGAKFTEVRDGEILSAALYWNMADLLAQVGVLHAPAQ